MSEEELEKWKERTKSIYHITEYTRFWNYIDNLIKENERLYSMINAEIKISNLLPDETDFIILRKKDYNRMLGSDIE